MGHPEVFLDGVEPIIEVIRGLPPGASIRIWDSRWEREVPLVRNASGLLKIVTGADPRNPLEYDISDEEAFSDLHTLWEKRQAEARELIKSMIGEGPY